MKFKNLIIIYIIGFTLIYTSVQAQEQKSLNELREMAYQNNGLLKSSQLQVKKAKANIGTAFKIEKTELYYAFDENDLAPNGIPNNKYGVKQNFSFPTFYGKQRNLKKATYNKQESFYQIQSLQIEKALLGAYYQLLFEMERIELLTYLDSIYSDLSAAAEKRYKLGETNYLEKINTTGKVQRQKLLLKQAEEDRAMAKELLLGVIQTKEDFVLQETKLDLLEINLQNINESPVADFYDSQIKESELSVKAQEHALLPDLSLEYFQGTNEGLDQTLIGYQFGLKIPLFFGAQQAKIKTTKLHMQSIEAEAKDYDYQLKTKYRSLLNQLSKHRAAIDYYHSQGQELSAEIRKAANKSYLGGEIDYFEYIMSLENATQIELEYLNNVNSYNQTVIQINNLTL
jgi:cobalt-zinc-cadmium resistance protein CzcA